MNRINWQDGGGGYPPGSDTPDAPWNQPDQEVTDQHIKDSTAEVWFLLEWTDNPGPDTVQFYDVYEMIENVCTREYYDDDFRELLDEMEVVFEKHGTSDALNMMPQTRRDYLKRRAEAWIDDRSEERAAFPGLFE